MPDGGEGRHVHVTARALERAEAEALLARHHVGRMAFSFHDRTALVLVNYVFADGWIYARMEDGGDAATLQHHHWVVFEVDEVDGIYDWRAVTVRGSVEFLSDDPHSPAGQRFAEALGRIRTVVPSVRTPDDPLPQRERLYRVLAEDVQGQEMSSDMRGVPSRA